MSNNIGDSTVYQGKLVLEGRKVTFVRFHTSVFCHGVNLGDTLPCKNKTFRLDMTFINGGVAVIMNGNKLAYFNGAQCALIEFEDLPRPLNVVPTPAAVTPFAKPNPPPAPSKA